VSAPRLRAVLFDAGNTLMHLDYGFIVEVLAAHGHPATPLAVQSAEYAAKGAIDRALAPGAPPGGVERLLWPDPRSGRPSYFATVLHALGISGDATVGVLAALHAHNAVDCLWRVIEPDTHAVLDALRARGLALGVVSNADGRVEADLARRGLGRHFATVVDSHVVGVEKPDARIFRLALERLGVEARAALYVGDVFAIDVLGARGAGLDAVLIDPLGRYPGAPDARWIRALAELPALLDAGAVRSRGE
jgi:HAD superfamily hydrolase (TIGR01509 family)